MENFQFTLRKIRRSIIGAAGLFMVMVIGIVGFVPVDEKVPATGVVTAEEDVFLYAPESGVIQAFNVAEGATVKTGDLILSLDTANEENHRTELEADLREAQAQLEFKKAQFDRISKLPLPKEFWHVRTELAEAEDTARHATVQRQRYQELLEAQLTSRSEFDQRKLNEDLALAARDAARQNVAVLERGLEENIVKEAVADLNAVTARVEKLKTDLVVNEHQIEHRRLHAPVAGKITQLVKRRPGEGVVKGEELIHLSRGEANRVRLYVGETQIHRIHAGQLVRLKSRAFDTFRYGYVEARVEEIALEPNRQLPADAPAQYRVTARIDQTPVPLALGSTMEGDIILRRLPMWRLLFPERGQL